MSEKYSNMEYVEFSEELEEALHHPKKFWKGQMQCYALVEKLHKKSLFKRKKEKLYWFVLGNKGNIYFFKNSCHNVSKMNFSSNEITYMTVGLTKIEITNKYNKKKYLVEFFNIDTKKKFDDLFKDYQRLNNIEQLF